MRRSTIHRGRPWPPIPPIPAFWLGGQGRCGEERMARRWDDWDKMKSKRHRHGRPDWSRPGRVDLRAARDAEREAERERRRSRRRGRELTPEEETYLEARRTAE